jgi:hypothetical protein
VTIKEIDNAKPSEKPHELAKAEGSVPGGASPQSCMSGNEDRAETPQTVRALLYDLIDYAGLFPPASLAMSHSVANYETYLRSEWSWILGRFIVPAARLGEFETAFDSLPPPPPESAPVPSRISLILGDDLNAGAEVLRAWRDRSAKDATARSALVESVEVRVENSEAIARAVQTIPAGMTIYFEAPPARWSECMAAAAASGHRMKIRMGGETAEKFPKSESVVEFLRLSVAHRLPFKATAGLHHPLRSVHRLTYQPDSPSGVMHGFLNLFLAAAFLRAGMEPQRAVQLLDEYSEEALRFDSDGVNWREAWLPRAELIVARRESSISFGSCSFTEPIDDLRSLGLLGNRTSTEHANL